MPHHRPRKWGAAVARQRLQTPPCHSGAARSVWHIHALKKLLQYCSLPCFMSSTNETTKPVDISAAPIATPMRIHISTPAIEDGQSMRFHFDSHVSGLGMICPHLPTSRCSSRYGRQAPREPTSLCGYELEPKVGLHAK